MIWSFYKSEREIPFDTQTSQENQKKQKRKQVLILYIYTDFILCKINLYSKRYLASKTLKI